MTCSFFATSSCGCIANLAIFSRRDTLYRAHQVQKNHAPLLEAGLFNLRGFQRIALTCGVDIDWLRFCRLYATARQHLDALIKWDR